MRQVNQKFSVCILLLLHIEHHYCDDYIYVIRVSLHQDLYRLVSEIAKINVQPEAVFFLTLLTLGAHARGLPVVGSVCLCVCLSVCVS